MKRIHIIILLSLQTGILFSQQRLNLDFEKESVEGVARPWGWNLDAWGPNIFSLDTVNVKHGRYSLKLFGDSTKGQSPNLQYNLEPYFIEGKTVNLKGSIQSALVNGKSTIWFGHVRTNNDSDFLDTSYTVYENNKKTDRWETFDVSFSVPKNVTSAFLKIGLEGQGSVWFDNLQLYIENKAYTELPVSPGLSVSEIAWIEKNAKPFSFGPEIVHAKHNLDFFKSSIGQARIVALGESTHGTSEFFKLKHQVFKYLVDQLDFRVFALEDNVLACERVNQYVLGKLDVDTEEAMSQLFAVWYTEEMKSLIRWIKERNIAHPEDPVYFAGFDMQDYKLPLKKLKVYLSDVDTSLLSVLQGFEDFASNPTYANDSIKTWWIEKTTYLHNALSKGINNSKRDTIEIQNAKLIQQFTTNVVKGHWSLYRDEAMAENITWLANIKYPNEKIFIWAHDVHVSKSYHPSELHNLNYGIAMGHFLRKNFRLDYKSFGLMTYTGAYLALKSYTNFDRVHAPLYPAPAGSLEEALHQTSHKTSNNSLFLDFGNIEKWLKRPLPFRFANHVTIDYGFWQRISIPYQFDGVFFMDETNPSNYMHNN